MSKKARLGCGCFGLGAMFVGMVLAVSVVEDNYRTAAPAAPPPAAPTRQDCCRVCSTGKACGNSCISRSYTCHKGRGCACNASELGTSNRS